jgi:WD40 repeat protein
MDRDHKELGRIEVANEFVYDLALSPDGRRVAGVLKSPGGDSTRVVVWDAADGRELYSWPGLSGKKLMTLPGGLVLLSSQFVHFSPDGTRVAAVFSTPGDNAEGAQSLLKIWDAATGKEVASVNDSASLYFQLAFRADGKQLVTSSRSSHDGPTDVVRLWDAATGAELKTLRLPGAGIGIALSPDGSRVATVMAPAPGLVKTVRITDVATGAEVHTLNAPDVAGVDFSPDGRRLATFANLPGTQGPVKVWDTATGQELLTIKDVARLWGYPAGFSADGHSLYALDPTNAAELRLHVWDATPLPAPGGR